MIINGQRIAVEAAAPTLSTTVSPELATITNDTGTPTGQVGTLVSALIDSVGSFKNFSDADGDSPGIAITGTNLNGGTLYYSTNNGSSWSDVGAVSESSARVLFADRNTRLAFVHASTLARLRKQGCSEPPMLNLLAHETVLLLPVDLRDLLLRAEQPAAKLGKGVRGLHRAAQEGFWGAFKPTEQRVALEIARCRLQSGGGAA